MNKKIITLILVVVLIGFIAACGQDNSTQDNNDLSKSVDDIDQIEKDLSTQGLDDLEKDLKDIENI